MEADTNSQKCAGHEDAITDSDRGVFGTGVGCRQKVCLCHQRAISHAIDVDVLSRSFIVRASRCGIVGNDQILITGCRAKKDRGGACAGAELPRLPDAAVLILLPRYFLNLPVGISLEQ